jgi:hypothetical protein
VKSENRRLGGWPILSPTFTCQHNPKRGWNFIVSGMLFSFPKPAKWEKRIGYERDHSTKFKKGLVGEREFEPPTPWSNQIRTFMTVHRS